MHCSEISCGAKGPTVLRRMNQRWAGGGGYTKKLVRCGKASGFRERPNKFCLLAICWRAGNHHQKLGIAIKTQAKEEYRRKKSTDSRRISPCRLGRSAMSIRSSHGHDTDTTTTDLRGTWRGLTCIRNCLGAAEMYSRKTSLEKIMLESAAWPPTH